MGGQAVVISEQPALVETLFAHVRITTYAIYIPNDAARHKNTRGYAVSGFVTIDRSIWDHQIFVPSAMTEREAWIWMISRASWAGTTHRIGSEIVDVKRGSFMVTLREMQSAFMWGSDKKVRNFLKKLEKSGMLTGESVGQRNARKTHVTICNYDEYQSAGRSKDAAKTHEGRTEDAVKEQGNKVTKEEANASLSPSVQKKASTAGSRISEDWALSKHLVEWALTEGAPNDLVRTEAAKFKDYWIGVAGAKGRKANWDATWRNWIRKAIADQKPRLTAINGGNNAKANFDTNHREYARLVGTGQIKRNPIPDDPFA